MGTAPQLDTADGAARALVGKLADDAVQGAIDQAITARTSDLVKHVTRDHAGEDPPVLGSAVGEWRLISLRAAGEHLLAHAEVDVAVTLEGRRHARRPPATVTVVVLLGHHEAKWVAEFCEPQAPRRLSERFDAAFVYASAHHARDPRKGTQIPYVSHLLAVASLVLEMQTGSEDEAIAALLHDVVEDEGGMTAAAEIANRFGPDVLRIVLANSDTTVTPKPSWHERKSKYIAAIAHKAPDELRVSLADKLHNARAILIDYRTHKEQLWTRFNATREQTQWYYRELANAFERRRDDLGPGASPALDEFERTVAALETLIAAGVPSGDPASPTPPSR